MKNLMFPELNYLRSIYDAIVDEIMILDVDLRIIDVNKAFCMKYSVKKEHILGKYCYNVTHGVNTYCTLPELECPVKSTLLTGGNSECIHCHQTGETKIYVEFLTYPLKNEAGQINYIVKIGRNHPIIEKAGKFSERQIQNLYENFPFVIFLIDSSLKIHTCNCVAELYFNKPKKDIVGKSILNLFSMLEKKTASFDEIIHNVFNFDMSEIINFEFLNHNDQEACVELILTSIVIENTKYVQVIMQDITERKLVENVIKEENTRLRELDQIKKQLMTQISENLKSPLNNIYEITDILLTSYKDQLDDSVLNLLEMIKSGGEKSINIVGKMLNISQIEADDFELNMQIESLNQLLQDLINEIDDKSKPQNIILKTSVIGDLYADIDKIRFKHIIKYIILSIIKNSSTKREIIVSLNQDGNNAQILIKAKKLRMKDLLLPKNIIELHGGQLIVNSERKNKEIELLINLPIKNWKDPLIHIYIIYKSGVPLYDHSFLENNEKFNASLISGGIIGLITVLREIIQGKKQIKTIDHGDRKLMFETNRTNDIIFVLIVKEDLQIFRKKLNDLIGEFDDKFHNLLENIDQTSFNCDNWKDIEFLITTHFK